MGYKDAVLADSPGAYWRLGEASGTSAVDASGNGHTGTISATGITYSQAGATPRVDPDTALLFDGSTGIITVPTATALHPGDVFSIESWHKTTTAAAMGILNANGTNDYDWRLQGNHFDLNKAGAQLVLTVFPSPVPTDGQWHHVVLTKNGATLALYYDGQATSPTVTNATMVGGTGSVTIGGQTGPTIQFNGTLDEVAIYSTALSATQVLTHYNAAFTPAPPTSLVQQSVKRASYY